MTIIFSTREDLVRVKVKKAVLCYSGGVDSIFAALQLKKNGFEIFGLCADVGQPLQPDLYSLAKKLNIHLTVVDLKQELCDSFIAKGILANALYNNHFPLSSTYSRPLIAAEAVKLAEKVGSELIVHSATPFQNSASRFNLSIMALAPKLNIYLPAIGEYVDREIKVAELIEYGLGTSQDRPVYSIDENVWARVIENDTLESPWLPIPQHGVFSWTNNPDDAKLAPLMIELAFDQGLPVELNGESIDLHTCIKSLNELLGPYGIGRYAGLEDGAFGVKNPEIREAPAAMIIHQSHQLIEEMVLTSEELRVKSFLDREWTQLVVMGGWYTPLRHSLERAIESFNTNVKARLVWRISNGNCMCVAKQSDHALYMSNFKQFADEFKPYNLNSLYQQMARKYNIVS